jgi:hypothetical protein
VRDGSAELGREDEADARDGLPGKTAEEEAHLVEGACLAFRVHDEERGCLAPERLVARDVEADVRLGVEALPSRDVPRYLESSRPPLG